MLLQGKYQYWLVEGSKDKTGIELRSINRKPYENVGIQTLIFTFLPLLGGKNDFLWGKF